MLVDTDVLIWYLRGNERASIAIENLNEISISVVTYIELIQGMRNRKELNELKHALRIWNAKLIFISEEISSKAMFYVERYFLSHSLKLADALIGTTALVNGLAILTGNDKHYSVLKDLELNIFHY